MSCTMGHARDNFLTGILPMRAQIGFEMPIPDLRCSVLDMRWFTLARNSSKVLRGPSFSSAAYFVRVYLLYFVLYVSDICNDTDKRQL